MEIHSQQEQFELFNSSLKESHNRGFSRLNYFVNINLTWENIILLAIFCLMLVVLSFSLGVEKGRRYFPKETIRLQPAKIVNIEKAPVLIKTAPPLIKNNLITEKQPKELAEGIKKYTIQVASIEKQTSAQGEVNRLKKIGYETWLRPSGKYNIICVGRFESKEEAATLKKSLQKTYSDCLIRRI